MALYAYNGRLEQNLQTDVPSIKVTRTFEARVNFPSAAAAANAGVLAAVTDNGAEQVISSGLTNPVLARNVSATAGGVAGDIKAIQVIVEGTNMLDEVITETLPAFTVDTAGTVVGNKAFKTITKVTIPAHDGNGATTAIGFGSKLGIPYKLENNTVIAAYLNNVKEAVAPTVTVSTTHIDGNTILLNSALDGNDVDAYLVV